jgi:Mrr N-terminal domain
MSRLNTSTVEEEIVLLYTIYVCGRRPSKGRATEFILSNHFLQERDRDYGEVTGGESRIENRIAWTRENLRRKGNLGGRDHGIWDITPAGIERLRKAAVRSLTWDTEEFELLGVEWKRFTPAFLDRLKALAEHFNRLDRPQS